MTNFLTTAGASYAWVTDIGRARARNEDSVLVDAALGLLVVADGMGGHNAGDVASRMATEGVLAAMQRTGLGAVRASGAGAGAGAAADEPQRLLAALRHANDAIYAAGGEDDGRAGMGTTVVAAWLRPTGVIVAHVGDSRLYRLRGGGIEALTRDHTEVQGLVDRGILTPAQARVSNRRNTLSRALGTFREVDIDCAVHAHAPADVYLLCSDGLTNMVEDGEIAMVVAEAPSLALAADRLVALANERGGRDNITVALVRLG